MTNDPLPFLALGDEIPGVTVVAVVLPILLVIGWTVYTSAMGRRRKKAIAAVVAANGFRYVADDPSRVDAFTAFPFGRGGGRRAYNVVEGTYAGGPFQTFAYSFVTTYKDSKGRTRRSTHRHQVTSIPLGAPFPEVRVVPQAMVDRQLFGGGQDLDTESAEFNRRWLVRAVDERIAHAILTGPMMERMLGDDVSEMILVFEGAGLMTFTQGESDLAGLLPAVEMMNEIAALIPPFLIDDLNRPAAV